MLGLVVLGVAWVVVTGFLARSALNDANADVGRLRAAVADGDLVRAERLTRQIRDRTDDAQFLTSGPAWWVSANLPVVGSPLQTGRVMADEAVRLSHDVLPGVVDVARTLVSQRSTTGIDTATLSRVLPTVSRAADSAGVAQRAVAATDPSWLPQVRDARASVTAELGRLHEQLGTAVRSARIALPMLGAQRPQRYFVGFLNEAEMRGGGGIPGAYAIAVVDRGRISFERFGTDADLIDVDAGVTLSPDLQARYGRADITKILVNTNLTPDFSLTGKLWAGLWRDYTGERIDGAIAIDPTALSYILRVTGPARVADGPAVTADSIVGLTQKVQYTLYPGLTNEAINERKQYLTRLARAVSTKLTTASDLPRLLKAVSAGVAGRRVTVWSATPALERQLQDVRWGGTLGARAAGAAYTGFVVNNAGGNKLDYYLHRTMTYDRSSCRAGATATATFDVRNDAPRSGLPDYVTYRLDDPPAGHRPGDNRMLVTYYADAGATITGATLDGKPVAVSTLPEGNTVTATFDIELPVGATRRFVVTVREPASSEPVEVLRQPGVVPLTTRISGARCS